jgi:hypothetical protein
MKSINEFTENDGILIETEQESQEIRELLHGMGLRWNSGNSYLQFKGQSVFPIVIFPKQGSYTIDFEKEDKRIAYPASDYLIKAGDEVEVRDLGYNSWSKNAKFLCKTSTGLFVVEDTHGVASSWDLIRKAPNPKSKAIAEIKKIAEKNGIDLKTILL